MGNLTVVITKDNKELKRLTNQTSDAVAYREMHRLTSCSLSRAIQYEGYKVEIIDESTNESYFLN